MANDENLRLRSSNEARENGRKGGIASGKARRQKKLLKECLEILLEKTVTDKSGKKMTGAEAMAAIAFKEALSGNFKAWEIVRDTAGQKPVERVVVADVDPDVINEVEAMVFGNDESSGG